MGLDQSKPLKQWDSIKVADEVRNLGLQYASYATAVIDNAVDGGFLSGLSASERQETMDDLNIQSSVGQEAE
jgi:hypothetical protein